MDNKIVFAILTLMFNMIGLPYFLTGNAKKGIFAIIFGVLTCEILFIINAIKGILSAIKIFKMTDEEFAAADKASLIDAIVPFCKD